LSENLGFVVISRLAGVGDEGFADLAPGAVVLTERLLCQAGFSMWNQGEPKVNEW
jgi:hypothetical protein